ncbi:PAS domain-containing protein [methanotrophic endosymbiont of Bathymodiolus puteoserpentis (Logatchev)]|jgi:aerotaxis receptor|uniref:PAS domain-containing protein n=1 Tax=methanotrophic endosymbiont of Bathymodiolus puteoserpentis (Logatchev) TaxID=343235 RepID=UPI0013C64E6B|nr:PAS domain-containing protein [methanotrophic endosymbiont of Bathymodiolus puteoserpentis (Logatchev)]SHE21058.1 Aerotaxis sensor receptor protein [methanotrophic endosymbiont of Bathymodiolus puteoserpentis (Logatchev)]
MLHDMKAEDITGDFTEVVLELYGGLSRKILYTEIETPYPDGKLIVSTTDTKGHIIHVNRSFVEMSGYEENELIGAPHSILRHPEMPPAAFKDLWDTVNKGVKWQGFVKNLRKDGGYYWVKATVIPNVRNGAVVGYTSVRRKPSKTKVEECIKLYPTLF